MKKQLSSMMEWIRPAGIGLLIYLAFSGDLSAADRFHLLGPWTAILMCGTVGFESLFLGSVGSEKIGYAPNRAYQIQSGLANLAIAITAALVLGLGWGLHAEAAITTAMLLFFTFSASNHLATAILQKNFKPVNLMRPVMTVLLLGLILPPMIAALKG